MSTQSLINRIMSGSLVLQIAIGIVVGVALSQIWPEAAKGSMLLGNLFVQALKAVAPILVLVLVSSAIANRRASHTSQLRPIVFLYLIGTIAAALLAVTMSTLFPTTLALQMTDVSASAPQGIAEVLGGLLQKLVDNPVNAILTGNSCLKLRMCLIEHRRWRFARVVLMRLTRGGRLDLTRAVRHICVTVKFSTP